MSQSIVLATIVVATIVANAGIAFADLVRAPFVLANSAEVAVPEAWLPTLASLKLAGAAGLVLGLFGFTFIGVAAATGLVLFYAGACLTHIRAHVLYNLAFPATFLLLAVGALISLLI